MHHLSFRHIVIATSAALVYYRVPGLHTPRLVSQPAEINLHFVNSAVSTSYSGSQHRTFNDLSHYLHPAQMDRRLLFSTCVDILRFVYPLTFGIGNHFIY